ncbi:MAG: efflux RND transporter periplasmic adaptor subunit [Hyphomonas sp.]|nr:efflux RND transporter periplasmic adaptor subunit [Hyphomonas sp.]
MKKTLRYAALLMPAVIVLSGCSEANPTTGHDGEVGRAIEDDHAGEDGHDDEGHVELDADEAAAAGILVSKAERGSVSVDLDLPAEIRFDADRVARISPNVDGIVARFFAGEGDKVDAGDTLALLTSRELASMKADYLNALGAEALASAELEREQRLWEQKITSQADLQAARAKFTTANAELEAAENRLHAIGITHAVLDKLAQAEDGALAKAYVSAPISGTVVQRTASLGEVVSASGNAIFVIVDDSVLWVDIAVYKEDLARVAAGQRVTLLSSNGEKIADAKIQTVLPVIDETSRTATARAVIPNESGLLKPGQFATARIETSETRQVLRVPASAVVIVEEQSSVFVPTDDGFEPRRVDTGASANGFTEIRAGLSEGDAFVSEGAFVLKAQLEKDAFGDGHAH